MGSATVQRWSGRSRGSDSGALLQRLRRLRRCGDVAAGGEDLQRVLGRKGWKTVQLGDSRQDSCRKLRAAASQATSLAPPCALGMPPYLWTGRRLDLAFRGLVGRLCEHRAGLNG